MSKEEEEKEEGIVYYEILDNYTIWRLETVKAQPPTHLPLMPIQLSTSNTPMNFPPNMSWQQKLELIKASISKSPNKASYSTLSLTPTPSPSALLSQPSPLMLPPSSLMPQSSSLMPQSSSLMPQSSSLMPQPSSLMPQSSSLMPQSSSVMLQAHDIPVHKKRNLIKNLEAMREDLSNKINRLKLVVDDEDICKRLMTSEHGEEACTHEHKSSGRQAAGDSDGRLTGLKTSSTNQQLSLNKLSTHEKSYNGCFGSNNYNNKSNNSNSRDSSNTYNTQVLDVGEMKKSVAVIRNEVASVRQHLQALVSFINSQLLQGDEMLKELLCHSLKQKVCKLNETKILKSIIKTPQSSQRQPRTKSKPPPLPPKTKYNKHSNATSKAKLNGKTTDKSADNADNVGNVDNVGNADNVGNVGNADNVGNVGNADNGIIKVQKGICELMIKSKDETETEVTSLASSEVDSIVANGSELSSDFSKNSPSHPHSFSLSSSPSLTPSFVGSNNGFKASLPSYPTKRSFRVLCRILASADDKQTVVTSYEHNNSIQVLYKSRLKNFHCDSILEPTQASTMKGIEGCLKRCLQGHNSCVYMYGQTTSAKTLSLEGGKEGVGLLEMVVERLLHDGLSSLKCWVVELKNDVFRDVLSEDRRLETKQGVDGGISLQGLNTEVINSPQDYTKVLKRISQFRKGNNLTFSHLIHTFIVNHHLPASGRLSIVHLAGSDRVEKAGLDKTSLREHQAAVKTLVCVGDVLQALNSKQSHVPHRSSKLTHLLQHSLQLESRGELVVHIRADEDSASETTASLMFAQRVRGVETTKSPFNKNTSMTPKPDVLNTTSRPRKPSIGSGLKSPSPVSASNQDFKAFSRKSSVSYERGSANNFDNTLQAFAAAGDMMSPDNKLPTKAMLSGSRRKRMDN